MMSFYFTEGVRKDGFLFTRVSNDQARRLMAHGIKWEPKLKSVNLARVYYHLGFLFCLVL